MMMRVKWSGTCDGTPCFDHAQEEDIPRMAQLTTTAPLWLCGRQCLGVTSERAWLTYDLMLQLSQEEDPEDDSAHHYCVSLGCSSV